MNRASMPRMFSLLGFIGLVVALVLGLAGGLPDRPANAQEPKGEPQYIELASPESASKEPQVEIEYQAPQKDTQEEAQSHPLTAYNYLRIVTLDGYTGRAMPGLTYRVYNRDEAVVAEVTSDCSGYVELNDLESGHYRVELQYTSGDRYIAYGQQYTRWMFIGAGYSATARFYSYPTARVAGIRANAYDRYAQSRRGSYLEGVPMNVYNYSGALVYSGTTNCSGFVDFFELNPGWYRVVAGTGGGIQATATPTYPPPPFNSVGPAQTYGSNETWVPVYAGYLVSVGFYLDPSAYPQATVTPVEPAPTTTPGPSTPTVTPTSPTNTPTVTSTPPTSTPTPTVKRPTYTPTVTPTPTATQMIPPPPPGG